MSKILKKSLILYLLIIFSLPGFDIQASKKEQREKLSFLTYNVACYKYRPPKKTAAIINVIKRSNADIIALQEVCPWFLKQLMNDDFICSNYYGIHFPRKRTSTGGLYTLSRYPIEGVTLKKIPSRVQRRVLITRIRVGETVVAVANVHLESPLMDHYMRVKQMNIVLKELKDETHAVFLGDFNFGDKEEPETTSISSSFADLWSVLKPGEKGYTWDMKKNILAWRNAYRGERSRRIDRILVKSDLLKPNEIKIVGQIPIRYKTYKKYPVRKRYLVKRRIKVKRGKRYRWKYVRKWKYRTRWRYKAIKNYEFPSDHFGLVGSVSIPTDLTLKSEGMQQRTFVRN